jgi:hypothetical protein
MAGKAARVAVEPSGSERDTKHLLMSDARPLTNIKSAIGKQHPD